MLLAKKEKIRDEKYLKAIRLQKCSASALLGCWGDQVSAHLRYGTDGGTGTKPSDCFTAPMCYGHHHEQHSRGEMAFWSCVLAEDTEQLMEKLRKAMLFDYAVFLFREKRGDDINRLFREWGT